MTNLQKNKVAVYCRINSNYQDKSCNVEVQKDLADKYIHLHGYELFDYYCDDGTSSKTPMADRPEGARLLQDAANKLFDTVLIYNLHCLGSKTIFILDAVKTLTDNGANVCSMTESLDTNTPRGLFFFSLLSNLVEYEAQLEEQELIHNNQ